MKLAELLRRLEEKVGVTLQSEAKEFATKTKTCILTGKLPFFPHASRPTWYTLVLPEGQDDIDEEEIRAILRHFWQSQAEDEFFKDN